MGTEEELYQLWIARATTGASFVCRDRRSVRIVSPGIRNRGAGPDFLDAVLVIGGRLVVGAVEMHLRESDWYAHHHQSDIAYRAVVLHVVGSSDESRPLDLPTLEAASLEAYSDASMALDSGTGFSASLAARLSWDRLLRRTLSIVRSAEASQSGEALRDAFLLRLFDSLGVPDNRIPMTRVATELLVTCEPAESFVAIAASVLRLSRVPSDGFIGIAEGFMRDADIDRLRRAAGDIDGSWRFDGRPSSRPDVRLWGGIKLAHDLFQQRLLRQVVERVESTSSVESIVSLFRVTLGETVAIGAAKARAIAVDAALPTVLAAGLMLRRRSLIESACRAYRSAPSLESNAIVRAVEGRFLSGRRLRGAFWQQGAIEFHQRYLSPRGRRPSTIFEPSNGYRQMPRTGRSMGERTPDIHIRSR